MDATVGVGTLALAGAAPSLAAAGLRWVAVPLAPLAGSVLAGLAATAFLATGGAFLVWFGLLAAVATAAVGGWWLARPGARPWSAGPPRHPRERWVALGAFVGLLALTAVSLRALHSPTVGFDARAIWLPRSGWFLQSHHQLRIHMTDPDLVLVQSAYPPLLSAANAVAWGVTGNHTMRLGVVVVTVLDACALMTACLGVVEAGLRAGRRWAGPRAAAEPRGAPGPAAPRTGDAPGPDGEPSSAPAWWPVGAAVAVAGLLVPVAVGITEPFVTNGYADPLWSLAAVGAVCFGFQLGTERWSRGVAALLVLACGLTKFEGEYTALCLVGLLALRAVVSVVRHQRGHRPADPTAPRRLGPPVVAAVVEAAAILAWTVLVRAIHARGVTNPTSPWRDAPSRARATFDGMAPYLHVLVVAVPVAVVGGVALAAARRRQGLGNDLWAWAGLAAGTAVIGGALVRGTASIQGWLLTTVHRVTEFPALAGWWIVGLWAVTAAGALGAAPEPRRPITHRSAARPGAAPGEPSDGTGPVAVPVDPGPAPGDGVGISSDRPQPDPWPGGVAR